MKAKVGRGYRVQRRDTKLKLNYTFFCYSPCLDKMNKGLQERESSTGEYGVLMDGVQALFMLI